MFLHAFTPTAGYYLSRTLNNPDKAFLKNETLLEINWYSNRTKKQRKEKILCMQLSPLFG